MDSQTLLRHLAALQSGDRSAFDEIYRQLKTPVYTIIYRILYDPPLAEDLMQEVFLRLYASPPDSKVQNPRAWVFRMARNLAIDALRRPSPTELPRELPGKHLEEVVGARLEVEEALRALSAEDRQIVTLHLCAGLRFREVAGIMQMPLGTVLWRYQRAIDRLRRELMGGTI